MARIFPSAPRRTPEEQQKLKAMALASSPAEIGALAYLEVFSRQSTGAPLPSPIKMLAPFELKLTAGSSGVADPVKIEFDANGDGKPELVQDVGKTTAPLTYTYRRAGDYEYVIRIHDRSGKIHTHKSRVTIMTPAALTAELRTAWNELKNAVSRGDRAAAMDCIHTQSRERYRDNFASIHDFRNKIDGTVGEAYPTQPRSGELIYELLPKQGSASFSYELWFGPDVDMIWRIKSF